MDRTLRPLRLPAVALFLLCTLPSRVDAQQFVCWPIAAGETVSDLARRLTGNPAAAYGLAFQIRDPARQMFVPKSHYQRLQSDWQACVSQGPITNTPIAYAPIVEMAAAAPPVLDQPIASPRPALASAQLVLSRRAQTPIYFQAAGITGAALLLIVLVSVALTVVPLHMPPTVRRDAENFVTVFARPLIDESSPIPPIQSRFRFRRRTQQLEISIAPGPGHRYPNLADHKKNVEYDVERVLGVLGNCSLAKPPHASGRWVVVTVQLRELGNDGNDGK